jgi:hypothetical protein
MSRTLRALVAFVMLAVIVAGCSSTSGGTGGTSTATTRAGTGSSNNSTRGKAVRFERNAHEQEGALAFAQCIRDNGVPDFPDPAKDEPMVDTRRIPSADLPGGMSILNAAMKKCGRYGPSAGVQANR